MPQLVPRSRWLPTGQSAQAKGRPAKASEEGAFRWPWAMRGRHGETRGQEPRWLEQLGRAEARRARLGSWSKCMRCNKAACCGRRVVVARSAAGIFAIYEKSLAQSMAREDLASLLGARLRCATSCARAALLAETLWREW